MNKEIRRDYFSLFTDIEDILFSCNEETGSYACIKDGSLEVYHPEEGPYPMVIPCPGQNLLLTVVNTLSLYLFQCKIMYQYIQQMK